MLPSLGRVLGLGSSVLVPVVLVAVVVVQVVVVETEVRRKVVVGREGNGEKGGGGATSVACRPVRARRLLLAGQKGLTAAQAPQETIDYRENFSIGEFPIFCLVGERTGTGTDGRRRREGGDEAREDKNRRRVEAVPLPAQHLPLPPPSHPHNFSRGGILGFSILSLCVCLRHGRGIDGAPFDLLIPVPPPPAPCTCKTSVVATRRILQTEREQGAARIPRQTSLGGLRPPGVAVKENGINSAGKAHKKKIKGRERLGLTSGPPARETLSWMCHVRHTRILWVHHRTKHEVDKP
ncbi:hypothetical protein E2C01_005220 [Portunus trituberculatus]|uniref:Uncharacterized protein n=1 Tax=Portunus trituberculatus TaxID=210409 RepID=A0A5B7CSS1_PORTR|nr:hypothetical protein [Portunus trituberculatus]